MMSFTIDNSDISVISDKSMNFDNPDNIDNPNNPDNIINYNILNNSFNSQLNVNASEYKPRIFCNNLNNLNNSSNIYVNAFEYKTIIPIYDGYYKTYDYNQHDRYNYDKLHYCNNTYHSNNVAGCDNIPLNDLFVSKELIERHKLSSCNHIKNIIQNDSKIISRNINSKFNQNKKNDKNNKNDKSFFSKEIEQPNKSIPFNVNDNIIISNRTKKNIMNYYEGKCEKIKFKPIISHENPYTLYGISYIQQAYDRNYNLKLEQILMLLGLNNYTNIKGINYVNKLLECFFSFDVNIRYNNIVYNTKLYLWFDLIRIERYIKRLKDIDVI